MNIIRNFFYKYRQPVLYIIIGAFCASIDYIIFFTTTAYLGVYYLIANILSVNVGIVTSFFLNRNLNFRIRNNTIFRFVSFYLVGVLGLAVSLFLLLLFVEWLSYDKQIAKIISIIIVALIQYLLNKHLTFSDLLFRAEDSNINNKNKND